MTTGSLNATATGSEHTISGPLVCGARLDVNGTGGLSVPNGDLTVGGDLNIADEKRLVLSDGRITGGQIRSRYIALVTDLELRVIP